MTMSRGFDRAGRRVTGRPFHFLLAASVGVLILAPLASEGPWAVAVVLVLLASLVLAIVWALRGRPNPGALVAFAAGIVVLLWATTVEPSRLLASMTLGGLLTLHLAAFGAVMGTLIEEPSVSLDTVLGAALGYLLIGVAFTFVYAFFAIALPGSIPLGNPGSPLPTLLAAGARFPDLLYFSFSTLSTLGYEDLTPTHPFVRSLSSLEAILGQLYLAVLVARLVGLHQANHT